MKTYDGLPLHVVGGAADLEELRVARLSADDEALDQVVAGLHDGDYRSAKPPPSIRREGREG